MKELKIILPVALIGIALTSFSQTKERDSPIGENTREIDCFLIKEDTIIDTNIIKRPHVMPQFPGGVKSLVSFIRANQKMLDFCSESIIRGRVVVRLLINKQGDIDNAEILRSLDPKYDKEALRVVDLMPQWIPAQNDSVAIAAYVIIPFTFK